MKKTTLLIPFCLLLQNLGADEISGELKAIHVLSDRANKYAPQDGSAYLLKLKYEADIYKDIKLGIGAYQNGDTGLTDWSGKTNAMGLFSDAKGKSKAVFGELYLNYSSEDTSASAGRMMLDTPLTKINTTLTPNFYEALYIDYKIDEKAHLKAGHINAISIGSQGATDWALVGEQTKTAGTAMPMRSQSLSGLEQSRFLNIGEVSAGKDSDGITYLGFEHKYSDTFSYRIWDYLAHDYTNTVYADMSYLCARFGLKELFLNAQMLIQDKVGKNYAQIQNSFLMGGFEIKLKESKKFASIAVTKSNDAFFFNAWGSDAAYTSSIFSRNEYRRDVLASKMSFGYDLRDDIFIQGSFAMYSKSKTIGWGNLEAAKNAYESDISLLYAPVKNLTLKLISFIKVSEYDGVAIGEKAEKKMNNVSLIASYMF
ncbi:MAG: hypothetical protein A3K14_06125 [Sulfurimonas sp. RIFCSPLOWO2_12_FULL_36_74]|nr:MAG: hypothetical protein A3J26_03960 [Sulfurimonas sp. RIFCSPLOWO2_02_FULL_36_28]OHE07363.1 MAG: hypothetical protein A3K14_06125 [Sulfurimonas sp. RIFCSPLOWO2_12_FULL_36_74]